MRKVPGSGSGSISHRQGYEDLDPDQHPNVINPEHSIMQLIITTNSFTAYEHRSLHAYFVACAITRKSYCNPEAEA
jgi:hypothetical protein